MGASVVDTLPIRLGTAVEFARVAAALKDACYDEATMCRTLKIEDMSNVGGIKVSDVDFTGLPQPFQLFVRLFLGLRLVGRAEVERFLDSATLEAFVSLGILGLGEFGADQFYAKVLLYPVATFLIASDRHSNPDGSRFDPAPDIVFPAIYGGTLRFLGLLPESQGEEALDLCAGTGIGAFVLSRCCKRAVSSDITERATQFALFNRALNNLENVEVVCGDLYSAVGDRKFDRIIAHPPYVPSLGTAAIWRDGGMTGELLVRRIIEELPEHLRAGGIFCIVTLGLDTKEGQFEERARNWLKDSADDFDLIFATANERPPHEVLNALSERHEGLGCDGLKKIAEAFEKGRVQQLPYGALVMRRHAPGDKHAAWTVRTRLSDATAGADFEETFVRHPRLSEAAFLKAVAYGRPQLSPRLQVKVTHVVYEDALVPAEYIFETDKPFTAFGRVDGWMVPLFTRLDGQLTPAEIYHRMKAGGEMPDGFGLDDFAALLARMIERGFLVLPD